MKNIVFLDKETLGNSLDYSSLIKLGNCVIYENTSAENLYERTKNAQIIITNKVYLFEDQLTKLNKLELICITATGTDNVDLDYCKKNNIEVMNARSYSTKSVTQHTFSLLFNILHNQEYYSKYTRSGNWVKSNTFCHVEKSFYEIADKNWGIIGLGEIGKSVANISEAFGCQVSYYSTSGNNNNQIFERKSLENLLKDSDFISIHAPLNDLTKNLLRIEELRLLKNNCIVLNLGRGGIINERDLALFLNENKTIRFGLDVLETEPMLAQNPLFKELDNKNLFITPHIAWASKEARVKLLDITCSNIKSFLSNK